MGETETRGMSRCTRCGKPMMYGKHLRDQRCEVPRAWLAVERKLREQRSPTEELEVWL